MLLSKLSLIMAVPIAINCQNSFEEGKSKIKYVRMPSNLITNGLGILQIGVGQKGSNQIGKSLLLNDLILPIEEFNDEIFEI